MALAASVVAVVVVYAYSDSIWPALELLLLFFSIPAAWYSSTWIACALHAAGMLVYTVGRLGSPFGFDLTFLTHWYVAATLLLTLVLGVTTFISWLLYASWCSTGRYIPWLENATALLIVALVSIQLFLTIASLAIISGYDGSLMSTASWRSASLRWVTQHSLGFFFAAALVGGRFECHNGHIAKWLLRLVWFRGADLPRGLLGVHALRLVQLRPVRHHGRRHVHRHRHARRAAAVGHRRRGHVLTRMTRIVAQTARVGTLHFLK